MKELVFRFHLEGRHHARKPPHWVHGLINAAPAPGILCKGNDFPQDYASVIALGTVP